MAKSQSIEWVGKYLSSSIGKKQLMAVTGLFWCSFLVVHLLGNLPLLMGDAAKDGFNLYTKMLTSSKVVLYGAETLLVVMFLLHIALAIITNKQNKQARPVKYAVNAKKGDSKFVSFTMVYSGLFILAFMISHIVTIKFGESGKAVIDGVAMRDMYTTVIKAFASPLYTAWYGISMVILAFHLSHGVQSAFQTFGLNHPKYNWFIKNFSTIFAVIIGGGNLLIAVSLYVRSLG